MHRLIAVTGGIGSGKSAVGKILKTAGYAIIDADLLAHEAFVRSHIIQRVKSVFGNESYSSDGSLNRDCIREAIFRDAGLRKVLESIIHPEVQAILLERVTAIAPTSRDAWVFYEFALLFETKREKDFDAILLVCASESVRIERVTQTRALTVAQVKAVMASQIPDAQKCKRAHVIVNNDGSTNELSVELNKALEVLRVKFAQLEI